MKISDLKNNETQMEELKTQRESVIVDLIDKSLAKAIYYIHGEDGLYTDITISARIVTSEDSKFIENLHYMKTGPNEEPIFVGFSGEVITSVKNDVKVLRLNMYVTGLKIVPYKTSSGEQSFK